MCVCVYGGSGTVLIKDWPYREGYETTNDHFRHASQFTDIIGIMRVN